MSDDVRATASRYPSEPTAQRQRPTPWLTTNMPRSAPAPASAHPDASHADLACQSAGGPDSAVAIDRDPGAGARAGEGLAHRPGPAAASAEERERIDQVSPPELGPTGDERDGGAEERAVGGGAVVGHGPDQEHAACPPQPRDPARPVSGTRTSLAGFSVTTPPPAELPVDHLAELATATCTAPIAAELSTQAKLASARTRRQRAAFAASVAAGRHELDDLARLARLARPRRLAVVPMPPPPPPPPPLLAHPGEPHGKPSPVWVGEIMDPDRVDSIQRAYCDHRDRCLGIAARRRWPGFGCSACTAYQPMPVEQWRAEVVQLARFGLALGRDRGSLDAPTAPIAPTPARPAKAAIKPRPARVGGTRAVVGDRSKGSKP